jgi:Zn-dependent protease
MKLAGVTFNFLMAPLAFYVAALLAGYGALAAMGEAVVWLKQALWDMLAIVLPFSNPHPLAYNPMFQHGPVLMLGMLGSLSLAMIPFNLLPVPPMDGYALLDHAVIKVTGRSLSDEENKWLLARLILAFVLSIVAVIVLNLAFAVYDLVHMLNSMHAG